MGLLDNDVAHFPRSAFLVEKCSERCCWNTPDGGISFVVGLNSGGFYYWNVQ